MVVGANRLIVVAETGSTNDDMRALAVEGEPEGSWLRADRQTGGKGRRGRAWVSPEGNLHASTLVRLREGDPPAPTLALVAAVALHDTVSTHLRHSRESGNPAAFSASRLAEGQEEKKKLDSRFRGNDGGRDGVPNLLIKWPNDLLLDGAKLAGILLERVDNAVIIGFGVNLAHTPANLDRPATSLAAHAPAPTPDAFLPDLAGSFARWLAIWRNEGLPSVRAAWLERAHPTGTPLSVDAGGESRITGVFGGLSSEGALFLRLANGSAQTIHAGDILMD